MTFLSVFDVPVFWPILLCYWIVLFVLTMKRQIVHMIKYKYVPFNTGKQVTDKMAEKKSLLNPDAAPYVPVWKLLYGTGDKVTEPAVGLSGKDKAVENSIEHQVPDTLDYDIKSFGKLDLSGASSSKTDQLDNLDEILQDEIREWDAKVDHLSSIFPDISVEYLAELLIVNGGDLEETVFVLQQFESAGDGSEDPVQAAVANNVSGIASEEASSSGTKD
ncbi:unnamed protein product [Musa acuminata var. zebrina]